MFYSQFFTRSNPHVGRCSNPLPWDPLSSSSKRCCPAPAAPGTYTDIMCVGKKDRLRRRAAARPEVSVPKLTSAQLPLSNSMIKRCLRSFRDRNTWSVLIDYPGQGGSGAPEGGEDSAWFIWESQGSGWMQGAARYACTWVSYTPHCDTRTAPPGPPRAGLYRAAARREMRPISAAGKIRRRGVRVFESRDHALRAPRSARGLQGCELWGPDAPFEIEPPGSRLWQLRAA